MRILELVPYVYIENHKHGSRNKSGLAYMIRSICDMLSSENEVHVLTQSILTEEQKVANWILLKRNFYTIISHLKLRYIKLAFKAKNNDKGISLLRELFYCISAGQAEDYIKKWHPDVIHIHGIGHHTFPYMVAAARCEVPTVVTLHGLISFSDVVKCSSFLKNLERKFIRMCDEDEISLTFISTGMKKRVSVFLKSPCHHISVIQNCFRDIINVTQKGHLEGEKRLVCVGSISELKNQIQVIRVLPAIQKKFSEKVTLHIIGDGDLKSVLEQFVKNNKIEGVTFRGRLSQEDVFSELSVASLLVFPSKEEGFGIPIVESYRCGTPVVTFEDLDASDDIFNECSTVFAKGRSDEELSDAIVFALNKEWNVDAIREWSSYFSFDKVKQSYNRVLNMPHNSIQERNLMRIFNNH